MTKSQLHNVLTVAAGAAAGVVLLTGPAGAEEATSGLTGAIEAGKPILQLRPRYEAATQAGVSDAEAITMRTRFGWETAAWRGVKALIEGESVSQLGGNEYNDGVPPSEPFATIADPEITEINRAQLSWKINDHFGAVLGRQIISLDDQRFVGPSNWSQDARTFDAARLDYSHGRFKATYVYVDHVNRHLGDYADWDSQSHLLNAGYGFSDAFKLQGFVYALDFEPPGASQGSNTYGLRASGKGEIGAYRVDYSATLAQQQDYGNNPADFDLSYFGGTLGVARGFLAAKLNYESLEGDGTRGFLTPIGSGHGFHGWAGVFGAKPADGLNDLNLALVATPAFEAGALSDFSFTVRVFDFEAERTGADLGSELDLEAAADVAPNTRLTLKYADYDGAGAPVDTTRFWVQLDFEL